MVQMVSAPREEGRRNKWRRIDREEEQEAQAVLLDVTFYPVCFASLPCIPSNWALKLISPIASNHCVVKSHVLF